MKKSLLIAAVLLLAAQIPAYSQISLFSAAKRDSKKNSDAPTTINADAMDLDIANNKATFLGNVLVDNPEMLITCRKMTIFLQEAEKKEKAPAKTDEENPIGSKELSRIECSEDVVITRKAPLSNGEEQKAFAGKAVYDVKENSITLLEKPLVIKGKSRVRGEIITLHLESERVEVVNATIQSTEIGSK